MARLFEQGGDVTPNTTYRVASGKAGTPTANHTWQTIIDWLMTVLGFLKVASNLSDLNDDATARTNLDVYSTGDIDTALGLKADANNVLERDNTDPFTPTGDYHPATKVYSDGIGLRAVVWASIDKDGGIVAQRGGISITAAKPGVGQYTITHNLGTTNYFVLAKCTQQDQVADEHIATMTQAANSFTQYTGDNAGTSSTNFEFIIFTFSGPIAP